ncbi:plasmolipin-like [Eriocheir sinensis]|uniref:plasmolipin-like n=1 Tax=Eriocheir sinensis TaxID=95602 RepID=UPI0021C6337B|nr:plasmolipin-like [Eriocheir sinensis]XP_050702529.1 plasmolipin-like [Eriocheir sinensis]XP_050702530.1 plasmolipin-like [Eriocheir sinensis]XP_050702532.1 plasmolipin-like [Eriocheir sinensis]XP_050702533.1 plasmolipin-like [Eriocheir sinensis]XP_050702534.1 plasmolipin-like [Eriocheir sinensis]
MSFPASHTTTTAPPPESTAGGGERKIFINTAHLRTYEGRLKLGHLVIAVLVFISVMASDYPRTMPANWISFVSMGCFWTSAVLLFLYLINAVALLSVVPWGMLELGYSCLWTFFWFVSGCVASDFASQGAGDAFAVAAFFSFLAMIIFGLNAFLFYKKWREGALSTTQPPRTTTTTTTTTSNTSNIGGGPATITTTNSATVQKY